MAKRHKNYDCIVSLGNNCEVSFRIRDYFGSLQSFPLSWAYVKDYDKFPQIIANPYYLIEGEIRQFADDMVVFETSGVAFHLKMPLDKSKVVDGVCSRDDEAIKELLSRESHIASKMVALYASNKRTLFIVKATREQLKGEWLKAMYQALVDKYVSGNFTLLIVSEGGGQGVDNLDGMNNCYLRFVSEFAPAADTDKGGDHEGWRAILKEFCPEVKKAVKKNKLGLFFSVWRSEGLKSAIVKAKMNLKAKK